MVATLTGQGSDPRPGECSASATDLRLECNRLFASLDGLRSRKQLDLIESQFNRVLVPGLILTTKEQDS